MSFLWNRILISPGNDIYLGSQGGTLLLSPPGQSPGAMNLSQMQAKVWHLMRVNGPANGFPVPSDVPGPNGSSDYPPSVVTADLNLSLAQFISDTGLAPSISERQDILPVYAVLDYPVPASLISLSGIEYNVLGGITYKLEGKSMQEYDQITGGVIAPGVTGQPSIYREIFAGYIRFQPAPGPGQAQSASQGAIFFNGSSTVGDTYALTFVFMGNTYHVTYTAVAGDTQDTIAANMAALVQNSLVSEFCNAGINPYFNNGTTLFVEGTTVMTYSGSTSSTTMTVTPTAATSTVLAGDTMTWYYSSSGEVLEQPGDTPGIPDIFHKALVYNVVSDYWARKGDMAQANYYLKRYTQGVALGKAFPYNLKRDVQPATASDDGEFGVVSAPAFW